MNASTKIAAVEMPTVEHEIDGAIQSDVSDESLIAQYRKSGDRGLYETLMRRYEREIYSYLRRYIGDAELAEDAFQGTFLQVHLKCHQFDPVRRFRPWLYAIATNQAIDVQRRNKRHRMVSLDRTAVTDKDGSGGGWSEKLVGDSPDPLIVATEQENSRWIHESVASLGESMQQVVQLVYYQGMKYREAADVLGIPVGTVKSRLHAAVQRLGLLWDESHEGSDSQ
ncbi:RNA polymerase sigma factor [Rubripirellula reticaptiva]|uniref:ECF RNA polymerase sigma factor SigW n=1 Tax=Rubripirellula reticaptiva TaxID=2528013 RepID=A0A5C6F6B3_9BACT|nr:ECF RNA polymerase sigma factor SigW [Rubripirellula reticaptiva]